MVDDCIDAEYLPADAVIPPKSNRKKICEYDRALYRLRHIMENVFLFLKGWWRIATKYAKHTASFLAAVHIRCIALWANISDDVGFSIAASNASSSLALFVLEFL